MEFAGEVLSRERGLNTPARRQALAALLEKLVDDFVTFERTKLRYGRRADPHD